MNTIATTTAYSRPEDTVMEMKCTAVKPYIMYLLSRYDSGRVAEAVTETGLSLDYLEEETNWVSYDYFCRFLRKVVEITGESRAPFDAARLHTNPNSFRAIGFFLSRLGTPEMTYRLIVQFQSLWNRISTWDMLECGHDHCVIRIRHPGRKQTRENCLALQGSLAAIPKHFHGLSFANIEERQCACFGGESCTYRITWQDKPRRLWGGVGFTMGLGVGVVVGSLTGWGSMGYAFALVTACGGYFWGRRRDYEIRLRDVYRRHDETAMSLKDTIRTTEKLNEELLQKVEQRTEDLRNVNRDLKLAMADLKESRERELIAEKQAAIGVLAGGTAHEMNNPLNAVSLCLQSLGEDIDDEALRSQIELAGRAARRCKRIVNDLLSFSREPQQDRRVSIEEILAGSLALFQKEASEEIEIRQRIASDLPTLLVDRMQTQQAIQNLLKNASDAMDGRGVIDVLLDHADGAVILSVIDRGPGIRAEDRKRIFDPFYTTKRTGKGMGLGLSITYQLIQRNGGMVDVVSDGKSGATFVVRFPVGAERSEVQGRGL